MAVKARRRPRARKNPDLTTVSITVDVHGRLAGFARDNGYHVGFLANRLLHEALERIDGEDAPAAASDR